MKLHSNFLTILRLRLRKPYFFAKKKGIYARFGTLQRPRTIGQPTHESHPHLLQSGEITQGCSALEYALRRAHLASRLPEGSLVIILSAHMKYRSGPVFYEFHQDPDFYYLTGFLEPDSICVIEKTGPRHDGKHIFHMLVRGKDPKSELWDGSRAGVDGARDIFNADLSSDVSQILEHVAPLINEAKTIFANSDIVSCLPSYCSPTKTSSFRRMIEDKPVLPIKPIMHELRVVKSDPEASIMRHAGKISGRTFNKAMSQNFHNEKDLHNFLEFHFRDGGCEKAAYVPVVASGMNALSIHYTRNDNKLNNGDLVLVDAGGQYGGYVTDITRTWPVNGKFTTAQSDLYQCVLEVQKKCISLCRETNTNSLDDIHRVAEEGLRNGLTQLGIETTGRNMEILFPHHVGHYVGIDLHDCGKFGRVKNLLSGHVVTIEPGVYIPDNNIWPLHFRGMGIRIEDTVHVGKDGPNILSVEAVKEVTDIEALRER